MSLLDDINNNTALDEGGNSNSQTAKCVVSVELYQAQTGKDKQDNDIEFIQIQFKDKSNKELYSTRQYLRKKEDGTYKKHIYPGDGGDILPSISYEILQLAKQHMGEDKYEALKTKYGGVNRKLFENLELELDVKHVSSDKGEYNFPQFAYDRKRDAEYRASQGTVAEKPLTKEEIAIRDNTVPF